MRMIQHGVGENEVLTFFEKFLAYCDAAEILVTTGDYTIFGKSVGKNKPMTLRIDVDEISEEFNKAHTVTVFIGQGETNETLEVNLLN